MARLEAVAKVLYYPTPLSVIDRIVKTVEFHKPSYWRTEVSEPPKGLRLLDTCAGEGLAASRLAEAWNLESYGVELDGERAKKAQQVMTRCLHGSYHQLKAPEKSFSVLFLNPPYDNSRDENDESIRQEVQFLIHASRYLDSDGFLVFIPPASLLKNRLFRDTLARHYRGVQVYRFPEKEYKAFNQVVLLARRQMGYGYGHPFLPTDMESIPIIGESTYQLYEQYFTSAEDLKHFKLSSFNPQELAPTPTRGVYASEKWSVLMGEASLHERPLVAPRPGHQAMLLAAGRINGTEIGKKFLVKGGSSKTTTTLQEDNSKIVREKIISHLSVLNLKNGELDTWSVNEDPEKTRKWFDENGEIIAEAIREGHTPLYNGDISNLDFSHLKAPGVLPGHDRAEFLPLQKEAAGAVVFRWKRNKSAIISGEMGTGKTVTAILACEGAKAKKVVVICPSHLVPKWVREVEVTLGIKGSAIAAKKLSDVDKFFASNKARYLIISKERAKLGSRWAPVVHESFIKLNLRTIEREPQDDYVRSEKFKNVKVARCTDCGAVQHNEGLLKGASSIRESKVKLKCLVCRAPLWQTMPLSAKGTRRWALARYINKKYARRYHLVVDELHQYAAADSDQSRAVQLLASASKKQVAMTGTLYGGRASSLFHVLFKVEETFRDLYGYSECQKFVEHHGLFETKFDEKEETSVYGYRRGGKGGRIKEIPGMSPAMIPMLLPYTLFIKLKDLRLDLPPYEEQVVLVPHEPAVQAACDKMARSCLDVLRKYPQVMGQYLMACLGYPDRPDQAEDIRVTLEDDEGIEEIPIASAPAFPDQLWPKDEKLIQIVKDEKAQGRKVLVFFTQTKRRDARPRLAKALAEEGLKVVILDSNIPAEKREEWLDRAVSKGFDVMFTNGKLVETGMDLLFANTIVQYGTEYSISTLRQSVRRSWRLGQSKPVKVLFLGYEKTMQAVALDLIARKMRAAELVDGDETGGLAEFDSSGSDFLLEIAQEAVQRSAEKRALPLNRTALRKSGSGLKMAAGVRRGS